MTNIDKIWTTLTKASHMCDDCLSSSSAVGPRQTVNIVCRELEQAGKLKRKKAMCPQCHATKIVNRRLTENVTPLIQKDCSGSLQLTEQEATAPRFSEGEFPPGKMEGIISSFAKHIGSGEIEIYNEFSLQHELGVFLRNILNEKQIQFERNVSYFGFGKEQFEKREMDIVVFDKGNSLMDAAIELKFPRNGQHPEQMYSFCKDVLFAEQLKQSGFNRTFVVIFAEDKLFYEGSPDGIYGFFRGGRNLTGSIKKPTGKRDAELKISGNYPVRWHPVSGALMYTIIEAQ